MPYCRTGVLPYAVLPCAIHHMPYAVLMYCRTLYAVRRMPYCRTPHTVPYALCGAQGGGRTPRCRTPYAVCQSEDPGDYSYSEDRGLRQTILVAEAINTFIHDGPDSEGDKHPKARSLLELLGILVIPCWDGLLVEPSLDWTETVGRGPTPF